MSGFIKGMTVGLAVGACVTMVMDPISDRQRHKMKRKTEGFFKNIGNILVSTISIMH